MRRFLSTTVRSRSFGNGTGSIRNLVPHEGRFYWATPQRHLWSDLETASKTLKHTGKSGLVIGPKGIGKSRILHEFCSYLSRGEHNLVPVFVDLEARGGADLGKIANISDLLGLVDIRDLRDSPLLASLAAVPSKRKRVFLVLDEVGSALRTDVDMESLAKLTSRHFLGDTVMCTSSLSDADRIWSHIKCATFSMYETSLNDLLALVDQEFSSLPSFQRVALTKYLMVLIGPHLGDFGRVVQIVRDAPGDPDRIVENLTNLVVTNVVSSAEKNASRIKFEFERNQKLLAPIIMEGKRNIHFVEDLTTDRFITASPRGVGAASFQPFPHRAIDVVLYGKTEDQMLTMVSDLLRKGAVIRSIVGQLASNIK